MRDDIDPLSPIPGWRGGIAATMARLRPGDKIIIEKAAPEDNQDYYVTIIEHPPLDNEQQAR